MAGAIGYALVQPPAVALVIFFALALGFAAPFTLISSSRRWENGYRAPVPG
jgi:thiol:disulfide interchange protein DsbD